jgi:hypothetical protein
MSSSPRAAAQTGDEEDDPHMSLADVTAEAHKYRSQSSAVAATKSSQPPQKKPPKTQPPPNQSPPPPSSSTGKATNTKRLAPQKSSLAVSYDAYDEDLLHRSVADAGRWAYGTVFVEVWVWQTTFLTRPTAGWWMDPVYHPAPCDVTHCQLCRLTDASRSDYLPPAVLVPGEGLPGVLWSDTAALAGHNSRSASRSSRRSRTASRWGGGESTGIFARIQQSRTPPPPPSSSDTANNNKGDVERGHVGSGPSAAWRDVKSLADDPDQPWNPRLQALSELGLGWAAAVPLQRGRDCQGIVIYLARQGVDGRRLRSAVNESYLTAAADLIAAALWLRQPRHEAVLERRAELRSAIHRVRRRILTAIRAGHQLNDIVQGKHLVEAAAATSAPPLRPDAYQLVVQETSAFVAYALHLLYTLRSKTVAIVQKTKGGGVKPPPCFTWRQTFQTFFGVFWTIAALTWLNTRLLKEHGDNAAILLGPFGALVTLLYGLTAAPASQPRNAVMGQTVAIGIALLLPYIPRWEELSLEWRAALTTALAVAAMVRLGLTHPPAGAAALLFALAPQRWQGSHLAIVVLSNVIAVGMATILNNVSDKRQYPTFWGLPLEWLPFGRGEEDPKRSA